MLRDPKPARIGWEHRAGGPTGGSRPTRTVGAAKPRAANRDIVRQAGVTCGALYHHFVGKEQLFRAVFEEMERDVAERIMHAAAAGTDSAEQLRLSCVAFLDLATDPVVQRVVLIDAPAVLG